MKRFILTVLALILFTEAVPVLAQEPSDVIMAAAEEKAAVLAAEFGNTELYATIDGLDDDTMEFLSSIAGDWAAPENRLWGVYLHVRLDKLIWMAETIRKLSGLTEDSLVPDNDLFLRFINVPATLINGRSGASTLFAASLSARAETRVLEDAEPGMYMILMDYGEEHPAIWFSAFVAADNAAVMSTSFVFLPRDPLKESEEGIPADTDTLLEALESWADMDAYDELREIWGVDMEEMTEGITITVF